MFDYSFLMLIWHVCSGDWYVLSVLAVTQFKKMVIVFYCILYNKLHDWAQKNEECNWLSTRALMSVSDRLGAVDGWWWWYDDYDDNNYPMFMVLLSWHGHYHGDDVERRNVVWWNKTWNIAMLQHCQNSMLFVLILVRFVIFLLVVIM